ncbi:MAG: class I SAM-dependent methyltransferase [Kiloniellales bacterium]
MTQCFSKAVDFGPAAEDYARYRRGFPERLFERLAELGVGGSGQRILDLGTGTGALARQFARRGAQVTGLDSADAMLAEARRLAAAEGLSVTFLAGKAEATGLPEAAFDAVTAGQCWHWFDGAAAAAEAKRLLKPGGRFAACHLDWLPLPGSPVESTEKLIRAHNPAWSLGGGHGLHPDVAADADRAGFRDLVTFSFDLPLAYGHEAWRGRIRASAGVAGSLTPEGVAAFDRELAAMLAKDYPDQPLQIPHRVFAMVASRP